ERPVREHERLRERLRAGRAGGAGGLLRAAPSAGREPRGNRQRRGADARALDQRTAGQLVGHGVPSSPASTTNVASGLNESATGVPGSWAATPAKAFWT